MVLGLDPDRIPDQTWEWPAIFVNLASSRDRC